MAASPLVLVQPAAADPLDAIEQCESGGRNVNNASGSSASGYFQIIDGTWRAYGGREFAPRAIQATRAEQETVARRILADVGTSAWNASRSCWAGKTGTETGGRHRAPETSGDRGSYVCDAAHLHYEACDPDNLGETVAYPRRGAAPARVVAPAERTSGGTYTVRAGDTLSGLVGGRWREVCAANGLDDCDLIYVGQRLTL